MQVHKIDHEIPAAVGWFVVAVIGWWFHAVPIAIIGALGTVTTLALFVWQQQCLTAVTYRRTLSQTRGLFGERVALEIEMVNDKLLPLSWFQVEDSVPSTLRIEGGTVTSDRSQVNKLAYVLPMLPYQRIRRHLTVVCTHRGLYNFGPATLSSGDPVGLRTRTMRYLPLQSLLVYPKVFALAPAAIASRVLLGETRSRFELLQDPSRIAGVREYRPGDPVRNVDWRATARSSTLLVREFEPSVALRVALFLDFRARQFRSWSVDTPELEFTVAVAASLLSDFAQRRVLTGLFSSGAVGGQFLAHRPSSSPNALALMLDGLARAAPSYNVKFKDVMTTESSELSRGTSVVVVATDFPEETLLGIAELRRRNAVTAIWVATDQGSPPPRELVDQVLTTRYSDDWHEREVLELAP